MRITNSMMISNMLSNLNRNLRTMSRQQDELATGKRVINASDDPVATAKILKYKADLADMTQYSINIRDAQAWIDATESSISEAGDVIQRVRELAVQAANGINSKQDTTIISDEIEQLKSHLISGANANLAGRYLFSSHYTDRPLLDSDGNYNIPITKKDTVDPQVAVYEVSVAERMKVGTHGYSVFQGECDASLYVGTMPTATSTNGKEAVRPSVTGTFSLTTDYSAGSPIEVTVAGKTFTVNLTGLDGSSTSLTTGQVVRKINNASQTLPAVDPTDLLSTYADVYFDQTGKLVISGKNSGTTSSLVVSAFAGYAALTPNPAAGADEVPASIVSVMSITDVDAETYAGKKFLMTFDGKTQEITFPDAPIQNNVADLVTQMQGLIDGAFGAGKVIVGGTDGNPLTFTSVAGAVGSKTPVISIETVVVKTPKLIQDLNDLIINMKAGNNGNISKLIGNLDEDIDNLLAVRADIGARSNRIELIGTRIEENSITFTRLLSDSQDADMADVIMKLKNAENVYKSALSVGGKIIQPSLMDFLR